MYSETNDIQTVAIPADDRPTDSKGRVIDVDTMTDRELLVEMVKVTRFLSDKAEQFLNDLPNNPMFKMMGKFF